MNKLLSAHFTRLIKNKCFRVCILFMAFMAVFRNIDCYLLIKNYNSVIPLESPFFTYTVLAPILLPVFCSLFLGTEFSDGTIRNKLIIGHSRSSVYLSSLIVCITTGFLLCLIYIVFSLCTGIPLLGFFASTIPMQVILSIIGCSFVLLMAYAAIHTFVAMLNQNRSITSIICILSVFLLIMIGSYIDSSLSAPETWGPYVYMSDTGEMIQEPDEPNPYYVSGTKRDVYEFLNEFLPGGQTVLLSSLSATHPGRMSIYSGLITIGFTGFGVYFFQKKDIK